jgi:thiamine-phosphate pyrophosphorylase
MLPAQNDQPAMKTIADCHLYGILDLGYVSAENAVSVAEQMCAGGIDTLQIRAKKMNEHQIEELASSVEPVTRRAGIPLILNDFPELVPAVGAQGAHVGQDDRPVADARWRAGRALADELPLPLIGKSTHSIAQAIAAEAEGADYIGFGPLFATATKPDYPPIGVDEIREVHQRVRIPIFCIGGIKIENLPEIIAAGATRVVIVSGILQAPDVADYTRRAAELIHHNL